VHRNARTTERSHTHTRARAHASLPHARTYPASPHLPPPILNFQALCPSRGTQTYFVCAHVKFSALLHRNILNVYDDVLNPPPYIYNNSKHTAENVPVFILYIVIPKCTARCGYGRGAINAVRKITSRGENRNKK